VVFRAPLPPFDYAPGMALPSTRRGQAARSALWCALAALFGLGSIGASCAAKGLALMPGVVNDPGNRSLRRAMFGFAVGQICPEFLARNLPLQLREGDPATGRFFPSTCGVQELGNGNLFLQFSGRGYAWTNITGRIGFEASAAVEYGQDFLMDGSTMYVYFRQKRTQSTDFRVLMVERSGAATSPAVGQGFAELLAGSVASASQQIGQRILQSKVAQGFTVVRDGDSNVRFALGVLEQGQLPSAPFERGEADRTLLANERTEIHNGQRDYLGPYALPSSDQALFLTAVLEGAPALDVLVVPKAVGDLWLDGYLRQAAPAAPPAPPLSDDVLTPAVAVPGQPPSAWRRPLRLPAGAYYVVLDHTASAGRSQPPAPGLDDRAAAVSYAVQLGDAP
jgi:hypothetical protein